MTKPTYEANIRAKAIQDFAEELKARSETEFYYDCETGPHTYRLVYIDDIDDLVAEMTGEATHGGGSV